MKQSLPAPSTRLAEVWSDTVDLRHLAWAIGIGITISVAGFALRRTPQRPASRLAAHCAERRG